MRISMNACAPVLFLVFNRPEQTRRVFEAIRAARPQRLYVAADGPRPDRPGEIERCAEVRSIATAVDWPCELVTLLREVNAGCAEAVSSAVTWFFNHEPEGIILEDDCLPDRSFFSYCTVQLERCGVMTAGLVRFVVSIFCLRHHQLHPIILRATSVGVGVGPPGVVHGGPTISPWPLGSN